MCVSGRMSDMLAFEELDVFVDPVNSSEVSFSCSMSMLHFRAVILNVLAYKVVL